MMSVLCCSRRSRPPAFLLPLYTQPSSCRPSTLTRPTTWEELSHRGQNRRNETRVCKEKQWYLPCADIICQCVSLKNRNNHIPFNIATEGQSSHRVKSNYLLDCMGQKLAEYAFLQIFTSYIFSELSLKRVLSFIRGFSLVLYTNKTVKTYPWQPR